MKQIWLPLVLFISAEDSQAQGPPPSANGNSNVSRIERTLEAARNRNLTSLPTQQCDPAEHLEMYEMIQAEVCAQSPESYCRKTFNRLLMEYGDIGIGILGMATSSTLFMMQNMIDEFVMVRFMGQEAFRNALLSLQRDLRTVPENQTQPQVAQLISRLHETKSAPEAHRTLQELELLLTPESRSKVVEAAQTLPKPRFNMRTGAMMIGVGSATSLLAALVARIFGFSAFTSNSTPAACAQADARYVNRDANNYCAFIMDFNSNVVDFLKLSFSERRDILVSNPTVCSFYSQLTEFLRQKLLAPRTAAIANVRCEEGGFQYTLTDLKGRESKFQVRETQGNGQVSVQSRSYNETQQTMGPWVSIRYNVVNSEIDGLTWTSNRGPMTYTWAQMMSAAERNNRNAQLARDLLSQHKLYSGLVQTCCDQTDPDRRADCMQKIYRHSAKNFEELQKQLQPQGRENSSQRQPVSTL